MRKGYIPIQERRRVKFNRLNQIKGMMKDSYGKQYERRNQTEVPSPRGRALHTERVAVGRLHGQRLDTIA